MTETELRQAIRDLRAFLEWALNHKLDRLIIPTLAHDLAGLVNELTHAEFGKHDSIFAPRSAAGYEVILQKEKTLLVPYCPRCGSPTQKRLTDRHGHWERHCTHCTWSETTG